MQHDTGFDIPAEAPHAEAFREARARIDPWVHRTPIFTSTAINEITGAEIFFKCENFQKGGAFKARGAINHVFSLPEDGIRHGVVTHSSGNHAQALAMAARARGIPAHIVMPETAPAVKVEAVRGYGASITFCKPTEEARKSTAERVLQETGGRFVHPYNDPWIIAGQGTAVMEAIEQVPAVDVVITPVGGGGLLSGSALAVRYFGAAAGAGGSSDVGAAAGASVGLETGEAVVPSVWGAEPELAGDAHRSLVENRIVEAFPPETIADGLRTSLGELTFAVIRSTVTGIALCREATIARAMRLIWERMKLLVEPSGAVPLASVLDGTPDVRGKRVVLVLSGGNMDLDRVPEILALEW